MNDLYVSLFSIAGTLIVVAFSSYLSRKQLRLQLDSEREARADDRRLNKLEELHIMVGQYCKEIATSCSLTVVDFINGDIDQAMSFEALKKSLTTEPESMTSLISIYLPSGNEAWNALSSCIGSAFKIQSEISPSSTQLNRGKAIKRFFEELKKMNPYQHELQSLIVNEIRSIDSQARPVARR